VTTFAALVAARADDDGPGLKFEDQARSWRAVIGAARARAALAAELLPATGPRHVGLLLENSPENLYWLLGCALSGATMVGINPTRRGESLARDVNFTDCRVIVTDTAHRHLLDGLALDCPAENVLVVDAPGTAERIAAAAAGPHADAGGTGTAPAARVSESTVFSLVFTSGTTSAPKAVICTQGRLGRIAGQQVARRGLTRDDVFYVVMPMFHSNAIMAGIAPAVTTGGTLALRAKFSASNWLADVRRYGATFFNYVGKPLNYILATAEKPDDGDNPLRIAFGNEANEADIAEFARRFDCRVIDSYGTSEGGMRINRVPGMPAGSLGVADEGTIVIDPETLEECPRAVFDADGRLVNGDEAIGEIVNVRTADQFEGYYKNPEADAERVAHGIFWSGDLAYRDRDGYWFFAGRTSDRLRVDGENFAAAPVERLLARFPAFNTVAVYAVPDPKVGDQVMVAAELYGGADFDPSAFAEFLAAQPDLGTKWAPRYVRITATLPRTPTNKIVKRTLQAQGLETADRLYHRPGPALVYEQLV